uniref:dolichyl-phosphate-mannose--protein mannosyltransferase n=1 Tax=Hucho hucho TaxID=62062 RepID=A0A4W5R8J6_9TELE
LVCHSLLVYMRHVRVPLNYVRAIKTNQDLLPETPWTNVLYDDFWGTLLTHSGSHKSFRPLCTLSFRLNHALGGLRPWGYHLVNMGLHGAVTGLFTALCRPLLGGGPWILLAGLLFASHPVHTEAVAGVVGRADVGAALLFLLSLLCYTRDCQTRGYGRLRAWMWLLGSLVCAASSMLWKEQGVTVLAVSAAYDLFVFQRLRFRQAVAKRNTTVLLSLSVLVSWGVLLLAARLYWMGNKPPNFSNSDNPAADSPHLLTRTLTFLYLPAANTWLLLCPVQLSFDWSMDALPLIKTFADWRNLHTVAFYAGFTLLAWFGLRSSSSPASKAKETNGKADLANGKALTNGHSYHPPDEQGSPKTNGKTTLNGNGFTKTYQCSPRTIHPSLPSLATLPSTENVVVFSLGLLSLPFLPATNLFFYVGFVVAERLLYIPSMGFCLLVAVGTRALYVRLRTRGSRVVLLGLCTGLVLLYGMKTVLRNRDWSNEEMLYKSGISVNPAKAWGNLGNVLKNQGKMAEAERAYRNALYYRGNMADMLYNLGLLLQENHRSSEALHYYKLAIGSRPTLACKYLKTSFHQQGEAVQKMPKQFAPQSLYNMMGEAYMRLNRLEEAGHWYRESLRAKPDHIPAHLTYGKLLSIIGQKTEAEGYYRRAIQLDPSKGNCYMHYGQFLLEQSRLAEAAEMAERAADLDSSEFDVVFSAAHMLRQASVNKAAERHYERAANLRPDYPAALMNLGAILHLNGRLPEAETNYLRALQLKPDDVITHSNLKKLWNIMERQGLRTTQGP